MTSSNKIFMGLYSGYLRTKSMKNEFELFEKRNKQIKLVGSATIQEACSSHIVV